VGVLFVDKEDGLRMRARCARPVVGVATRPGVPGADVVVEYVEMSAAGTRMRLATPSGAVNIDSPLVGDFNLENLALAVGMGVALELPADAIAGGLSAVAGVPGRLERVPNERGVLCVVDYAHTPDALERAIAAVRPLVNRGKLILVFGCGGDRDPGKRKLMGEIARLKTDFAVVTSDNPRTEDPERIIDMIDEGLGSGPPNRCTPKQARVNGAVFEGRIFGSTRLPDRRKAIELAAAVAMPGDVLLIAGKGHEDYQIIGTTKTHFDDREEAAAAFARLTKGDA
jgi:UDP-N-acetylmuramoyl-L-alanyl-D-glutamate--2,6-diaminopimelate ligase